MLGYRRPDVFAHLYRVPSREPKPAIERTLQIAGLGDRLASKVDQLSELWALIHRLRSEGVSILMSTHYIEEAERFCDEVTIMSHGKAVAVGPPRELIAEHAGPEAIEVYGSPTRLLALGARGDARVAYATHRDVRLDPRRQRRRRRPRRRAPVTNLEDVFVLLTGEEIA